jgi:hypothetical protein
MGGNSTYRILGVGHCVEGTEGHGELVDDEIIGVVLSLNDPAEALLVLGAGRIISRKSATYLRYALLDVFKLGPVHSILNKMVDCLTERHLQCTFRAFTPHKVIGRELALDDVNLAFVAVAEAGEDALEHAVDEVHSLVVVLLDRHLEIEAHELGQVPMGVTVLRAEDGTDLIYALKVGGDRHLLSELGRLGEEGAACEEGER